jgi:quinol monooxygenase YgiN
MIKVIIERHCRPDKQTEIEKQLLSLRSTALDYQGYITGETLVSTADPSRWLVISTWEDIKSWKAWYESADRREVFDKITPLLCSPEKFTIYTFTGK